MAAKTSLKSALTFPLFSLLLLFSTTAHPKTVHVDDDGPADFNSIQAAIDDSNHGDVVIVAEGTYFENINFNGKNITLRSTDPYDPNVVAATIIDGGQNGSVVTFNSGEDANCVLNGFTITNGYADHGGGIYCGWPSSPPGPPPPPPPPPRPPGTLSEQSSPEILSETNLTSPTIKNCIISNNSADPGGGMCNEYSSPTLTNCAFNGNSAYNGGGICNYYSSPTLTNCAFNGNSTDNGGGICNYYSNPTLTNCTFTDNSAVGGLFGWGGGVSNYESSPILTNCTFNENSASDNGGGMYNRESSPIMTNCTFSGNSAGDEGGGIYNNISSPTMTDCAFSGNLAILGGGMYNGQSNPILTNCTFNANLAEFFGIIPFIYYYPLGLGGGMHNNQSSPALTNCSFNENSAYHGGGMYNNQSTLILINCTFTCNSVMGGMDPRAPGNGGGIYNNHSKSNLTKCTFNENSADYGNGGGIYNSNYSSPIMTNCAFSGNSAGSGGGMYNSYSSPILAKCSFSENSASSGGGMYNGQSNSIVANCTFIANSARWGGGIDISYNSSLTLKNCTFVVNLAEYNGGGIYNGSGITTLANCILWENRTENRTDESAQIYGQPVIVDYSCIQGWTGTLGGTGNIGADPCFVRPGYPLPPPPLFKASEPSPADGMTGISLVADLSWTPGHDAISHDVYFGTANPPPFIGNQTATTFFTGTMDHETVYYWRIDEVSDSAVTVGDIWSFTTRMMSPPPPPPPPTMLSASYVSDNEQYILTKPDYHLLPDSPCINAGDPNYVAAPNETDLDGYMRVVDGRIDMGAYEYAHPTKAEVSIVPNTINPENKGSWITCYIRLPQGSSVADIDPDTVFLEDQIQPEQFSVDEQKQVATARFNREEVQAILVIGEIELTITGRLTDPNHFEGTDVIKVIHKASGKPDKYEKAGNPDPPDGATEVSRTADLSWTPSSSATSRDVYFGTANPPPFVCNQTATTFEPGTMDYETIYYWRIDEINKWGTTTGDIWHFTTVPFSPPPPPPPPPPT